MNSSQGANKSGYSIENKDKTGRPTELDLHVLTNKNRFGKVPQDLNQWSGLSEPVATQPILPTMTAGMRTITASVLAYVLGMEGKHGNTDIAIGVCMITYGIAAEFIYLVVLKVMVRKEHRRLSCYKIMIALGLYDMFAIALNSMLTGYFWIVGANYCMMPKLMFVAGAIALGLWCGACMNCFMLVINRLLDLWNKDLMLMIFKGGRTYVALLLPTIYSLYFMFFTPPLLFNSDHTAWFFSSFVVDHDGDMFFNYPHTANNLLIVVITCLLYVQYARILLRYHKSGTGGLTWAQKSFFMQSSSICMANLIAALIYVYMQFFETPSYFVLVGHICWQLGHGFPAFVYLFLNKTIQKEALLLLGIRKRSPLRSVSVAPSKTMLTEH